MERPEVSSKPIRPRPFGTPRQDICVLCRDAVKADNSIYCQRCRVLLRRHLEQDKGRWRRALRILPQVYAELQAAIDGEVEPYRAIIYVLGLMNGAGITPKLLLGAP